MAAHSSMLAWRISRTEEPGWLQATGSQRVEHDLMAECECEKLPTEVVSKTHFINCCIYFIDT